MCLHERDKERMSHETVRFNIHDPMRGGNDRQFVYMTESKGSILVSYMPQV